MSKKAHSTRIGAFVLLSLFLMVTSIVILGGDKLFSNKDIAIVYFEGSLQGLNVGAPVAYRGITIGEIKEIQIDVDAATYQITVPVLISLIPDKVIKVEGRDKTQKSHDINTFLKTMCDKGLRATLKSQSLLTGKLYIDLAIHENSQAVYHDKAGKYLEIPAVPSELQQMTQAMQSLDFLELAAKVSNTMASLEKMSISLEQALNSDAARENLVTLSTSLTHFNSILSQFDENLLPLIGKVHTTIDKIAQLSDNTNHMITHVDGHVEPFFATIDTAALSLGSAMHSTDLFMAGLQQSTAPDSPLYYQLTEGIQELSKAVKSIQAFTEYLNRHPQMLFLGTEQQGETSR